MALAVGGTKKEPAHGFSRGKPTHKNGCERVCVNVWVCWPSTVQDQRQPTDLSVGGSHKEPAHGFSRGS